mgnify:CR=1 FL=1
MTDHSNKAKKGERAVLVTTSVRTVVPAMAGTMPPSKQVRLKRAQARWNCVVEARYTQRCCRRNGRANVGG